MYKSLITICLLILINGCEQAGQISGVKNQVTDTICISGMVCEGCVQTIGKKLKEQEGVVAQNVSLKDSIAVITYDKSQTDQEKIQQAIKEAGYGVKRCVK